MIYQADTTRYDTMQYRRCGRSGILLPVVSLGLWQNFGDVDSLSNSRAMLHYAFDHGITHFDLANNYGPSPGSAEATFGQVMASDFKPYRDEMIISSKAGYDMWPGPYGNWGSRKFLIASCEQSLQRMGLGTLIFSITTAQTQIRRWKKAWVPWPSLVQQGKALYVGLSNYRPERAAQAAKILRDLGTPCLIHQPRYNMFDRWITDVSEAGQNLTTTASENGFGLITFSPLWQGQLTNKYLQGIPADSRAARKGDGFKQSATHPATLKAIQALAAIAQQRGQSLAQMALAWNLRLPETTSVLIGASKVSQIEDSIACQNNLEFSAEELAQIDNIVQQRATELAQYAANTCTRN